MTAKEYLQQAYRLDSWIDCQLEEVASLRQMAVKVSALSSGERVQTSKSKEKRHSIILLHVGLMNRNILLHTVI